MPAWRRQAVGDANRCGFVGAFRMDAAGRCTVALTTRIVDGRWKVCLVWALVHEEPRRLAIRVTRYACPSISDRMLTRELELWGLVSRQHCPTVPPRAGYRLSELGRSLKPVMAVMPK